MFITFLPPQRNISSAIFVEFFSEQRPSFSPPEAGTPDEVQSGIRLRSERSLGFPEGQPLGGYDDPGIRWMVVSDGGVFVNFLVMVTPPTIVGFLCLIPTFQL